MDSDGHIVSHNYFIVEVISYHTHYRLYNGRLEEECRYYKSYNGTHGPKMIRIE